MKTQIRWDEDVKQVKLSVEGADVQIANVALPWDNRKDDTLRQPEGRTILDSSSRGGDKWQQVPSSSKGRATTNTCST
jgi:hypothetical protein